MTGAGCGGQAGQRHKEVEVGIPYRAGRSRSNDRRMHPLSLDDRHAGDIRLGLVRGVVGVRGRQPDGITIPHDQPRRRVADEGGQRTAGRHNTDRLQP